MGLFLALACRVPKAAGETQSTQAQANLTTTTHATNSTARSAHCFSSARRPSSHRLSSSLGQPRRVGRDLCGSGWHRPRNLRWKNLSTSTTYLMDLCGSSVHSDMLLKHIFGHLSLKWRRSPRYLMQRCVLFRSCPGDISC